MSPWTRQSDTCTPGSLGWRDHCPTSLIHEQLGMLRELQACSTVSLLGGDVASAGS